MDTHLQRAPRAHGPPRATAASARTRGSRWTSVALLILLLFTGTVALQQAWQDAPTVDEPLYVSAGLTSLTRHDLRINPQHPPLGKAIAALPVLFAHPPIPSGPSWTNAAQHPFERDFVAGLVARHQLREVTFLSRLFPVAELLAATICVFLLGRRLAGEAGGLVAAALWSLDPFVVGIGHLDGIDLPFTLVTLLSALALWRWIEDRSTVRAVVLGATVGASVLVRATGPLLVLGVLLAVAVVARAWRPCAVLAGSAYATVWAGYLAFDPVRTLAHPMPLPSRYLHGLKMLHRLDNGTKNGFLLGHHWHGGQWWFYPGSMLVKLPLTLLVAFVLASAAWPRLPAPLRREGILVLAPPAVLLGVFTVASPQNLGLRYLMPVVALLTVQTALLVRLVSRRSVAVAGVLVAGSGASLAASLPHSLAFTQPPFRPGYRVAVDSNLDWGQDFYALQRWAVGKNPSIRLLAAGGLDHHLVPGARVLHARADPAKVHGWVAISATRLNGKHDQWLLRRRPSGVLNGTIVLYHLP